MNTAARCESTKSTPGPRRHRLRRFAAVGLIAASAFVLSATSASADIVVDHDPVKVSGGAADFGSGALSATGTPEGNGDVAWAIGLTANTARVTGKLYYVGPEKGCASLRLTLYNISGNRVANQYTKSLCRAVGAATPTPATVDYLLSDALASPENNPKTNGFRARIVTRVSLNGGLTWTEGAFKDTYLGDQPLPLIATP